MAPKYMLTMTILQWMTSPGTDRVRIRVRVALTSTLTLKSNANPYRPGDGDGCNGGPKKVTVCGQSGILYDGVYPLV